MKTNLRWALLLLPLAGAACAPTTPPPAAPIPAPLPPAALTPSDSAFAASAAQSNQFAIQASQIAAQKAARPGIREFAQGVVDAQTQANGQLAAIARTHGMDLPQALTPAQAKTLQLLTKTPDGARFRRTYFAELSKSQLALARQMDAYAATGSDPDLKAFATAQAPALRDQVARARALPRTR